MVWNNYIPVLFFHPLYALNNQFVFIAQLENGHPFWKETGYSTSSPYQKPSTTKARWFKPWPFRDGENVELFTGESMTFEPIGD